MGNPFVHIELHADDVARSKKFYKSLFDWQLVDSDMGGGMVYTMLNAGEGNVGGGMMKKQGPEAPSQWLSYVQVDSVKKTIAKARKLGAQVVVEFQPIPNMGAFGIFVDPNGAPLGLFERLMPPPKPAKKAAAKKPAAKKPAAKAKAKPKAKAKKK